MLIRALVLLAVIGAAGTGWWVLKRAPRGLTRLDLPELGVSGPAIVQFSAPYCGPCTWTAPVLARTAAEASVTFRSVDVAACPELASRYHIRTVPTIVVAAADGSVLGTWTALPQNGEIAHAAQAAALAR
ncbi:MAG TPA: thioredoxin family protein [Actinomycetota bacterium]|nr:thioredoxin family protein [Actinomycetota bacterium]